MDKLIEQFKLQNFLRQMFCGIVFLLPFFLFSAITGMNGASADFREVCIKLHELNLSAVEFTGLAVLAIIVGTLIYHLEKNIWSYSLQILFTSRIGKKRFSILGVLVPVLLLPFFVPCESVCGLTKILTFDNFTSFVWRAVVIMTFFSMLVSLLCVSWKVVEETRAMWIVEGGRNEIENNSEIGKIIMGKVSTWSDFVHCGQSCAWAWILGSMAAYVLFKESDILTSFYVTGVCAAVCLLVAEAFIDWHRWQHVERVVRLSSKKSRCLCIRMSLICRRCSHNISRKCVLL